MSAPTVVVVQSGDLAAWVGAISGLAGVVLGFGLESLRRRRSDYLQTRSALRHGLGRFVGAAEKWVVAQAIARDLSEPVWVQIAEDRARAMTDAFESVAFAADPLKLVAAIVRVRKLLVIEGFSEDEADRLVEPLKLIGHYADPMSPTGMSREPKSRLRWPW